MLVGVYEKELKFIAKVKNGFVPRVRDELTPTLKALQTARCPFKNLPEKSASRLGEIVNRRENGRVPLGQTEARLPACIRRMDRCRTLEALHVRRHAR